MIAILHVDIFTFDMHGMSLILRLDGSFFSDRVSISFHIVVHLSREDSTRFSTGFAAPYSHV